MIADIETLKELIPTVTGSSFEKYKPCINEALQWMTRRIAGRQLMSRIMDLGKENELWQLTQKLVAYKAYLIAIPLMDVVETANGFAVVNDTLLAPASVQRVENLGKGITTLLEQTLETFIECLEDDDQYHADWSASPTFSIMYESYIPTLRMFRRYGTFRGSYSDFINSAASMRAIITEKIEPTISWELSKALLIMIRNGKIKPEYQDIVEGLRYAQASYHMKTDAAGERWVMQVCEKLMQDPDAYPEFKSSGLYKYITKEKAIDEKHKSILPII